MSGANEKEKRTGRETGGQEERLAEKKGSQEETEKTSSRGRGLNCCLT